MILDEIVSHKRSEIAERKWRVPVSDLMAQAEQQAAAIDFAKALQGEGVSLIAEIKRASPSKGSFAPDLQAESVASVYARNGAAAISVLTDERYFSGSLDDLEAAERAVTDSGRSIPILRKDFILDPYQVIEARASGADAILLIVRILTDDELARLCAEIEGWGMTALVEVHDEVDVERIGALSPAVVGINQRNLSDFRTDLTVFARLRRSLSDETVVVAASGICSAADVANVAVQGADAVLVGEALVTAADMGEKVRELIDGGAP